MTDQPSVYIVPTGAGGDGRTNIGRFYRYHFVDANAPTETFQISRTVQSNRLIDEIVTSFVHDRQINWMLPGIAPTGKRVECGVLGVINFRGRRLCTERIYWDQAALLAQLGVGGTENLPTAAGQAADRWQGRR